MKHPLHATEIIDDIKLYTIYNCKSEELSN